MRATIYDLPKHPSWVGSWLQDHPMRTKWFWHILLFEKGQGWLRWGIDERTHYEYIDEGLEAPEPYTVAPPLRCLWWYVRGWLLVPYLMLVGYPPDPNDPRDKRYRYAWEEARLTFYDCWHWYRCEDRYQELWGHEKAWLKRKKVKRTGR